jgi:hypothetical protein
MRLALQGKHTVEASELYMAFELSEKNWKLSLGDGVRSRTSSRTDKNSPAIPNAV